MDLLLKVENIQKTYSRPIFPPRCSLQIRPNQIHMVLGGSGMGKSTLFNVILGVIKPDQGTIDLRAPFSFLMTDNHFDLQLSLKDNFLQYYKAYSLSYVPDFEEVLSKTEQTPLDTLAKNCSFGTLRRFALYRVLFQKDVKLCFLDEPTTGADVNNVKKLKNIILDKKDKMSFFIVTHDKQLTYIATNLFLISQIVSKIDYTTIGGFLRLRKSDYDKLNFLTSNLLSDENKVQFTLRNEDSNMNFNILYLNTMQDNVIIKVDQVLTYNRLVMYLRELNIAHKCAWLDNNSLNKFIELYF